MAKNNLMDAVLNQTTVVAPVAHTTNNSKVFGVTVSIVTPTKVAGTFIGSALRNDINFFKPMNYDKGLPELKDNASVEAQVYHLSIQQQHEEYDFFTEIGSMLLENNQKDFMVKCSEIDATKYAGIARIWGNTGMAFYFHNNTIKSNGVQLSAADKAAALDALLD